jgi:MFS family permease
MPPPCMKWGELTDKSMRAHFSGLWRHPDFLKFWLGETISVFGSSITGLALPLVAVLTLDASAAQMGLLGAAGTLPFLLVSLFAGVWVDRMRRRPIMIWADVGRALVLAWVPIGSLLNLLTIEHLYIVAFLSGILMVFFDIAYQSYLPSLVSREHLVEGNSKLEASRSMAQIAGPGLAGALVELVTGPIAIALDALSFLLSALFLGLIGKPEPAPAERDQTRSVWSEIGEGLRVLLGHPLLRPMAGCTATSNLFSSILYTVYVLYATRELGLEAGVLGVVFGLGSLGGLLGSFVATRTAARFGLGRTIMATMFLSGAVSLLIPLARGPVPVIAAFLVTAQFFTGLSVIVYNINVISLRQVITPDRLLGRVNASMRFLVWGTLPVGALLGGLLGERIGLAPTLVVGAIGMMGAFLWLFFSPVRTLREQPPSIEEALVMP